MFLNKTVQVRLVKKTPKQEDQHPKVEHSALLQPYFTLTIIILLEYTNTCSERSTVVKCTVLYVGMLVFFFQYFFTNPTCMVMIYKHFYACKKR